MLTENAPKLALLGAIWNDGLRVFMGWKVFKMGGNVFLLKVCLELGIHHLCALL